MRQKIFMRMITIIAICDFIGCLTLLFGFPSSSSLLCTVQGVISICFLRASILWTVCLAWQLYCLVLYQNMILYEYQMHLICWSITVALELAPLLTNDYGSDDVDNGRIWCYIKGAPNTATIWIITCFTLPLVVSICLIIAFCLRLSYHHRETKHNQSNHGPSNDRIKAVVDILKYYPIIMIICWLPNGIVSTLSNLIESTVSDLSLTSVTITLGIGSLYGFFLTVLFFLNSTEARERWFYLIHRYHCDHRPVFTDYRELEDEDPDGDGELPRGSIPDIQRQFLRTFSVGSCRSTGSVKDLQENLVNG